MIGLFAEVNASFVETNHLGLSDFFFIDASMIRAASDTVVSAPVKDMLIVPGQTPTKT